MTPADLLKRLRTRGFHIDAGGNKLLVSPGSRLTETDRRSISAALPELLTALADEAEWLEERAGILEFDAGLVRAEAERVANELLAAVRQRSTLA